jgi:hypothetical protein
MEFGDDITAAGSSVCHFRSLPRDSSKVSSVMILPTSPKEYFTPSYRYVFNSILFFYFKTKINNVPVLNLLMKYNFLKDI